MTYRAPHAYGGVHVLFRELRLVVAVEAERRRVGLEQLCVPGRMGAVAARASHGNSGVYVLFRKD